MQEKITLLCCLLTEVIRRPGLSKLTLAGEVGLEVEGSDSAFKTKFMMWMQFKHGHPRDLEYRSCRYTIINTHTLRTRTRLSIEHVHKSFRFSWNTRTATGLAAYFTGHGWSARIHEWARSQTWPAVRPAAKTRTANDVTGSNLTRHNRLFVFRKWQTKRLFYSKKAILTSIISSCSVIL